MKAMQGVTTISEVARVTQIDVEELEM